MGQRQIDEMIAFAGVHFFKSNPGPFVLSAENKHKPLTVWRKNRISNICHRSLQRADFQFRGKVCFPGLLVNCNNVLMWIGHEPIGTILHACANQNSEYRP